MEQKFLQKNLSQSGFDSFDLDDEFFMKVDSELKDNKSNEKQFGLLNRCNSKRADKPGYVLEKNGKKDEYFDLPLFIEDLNESVFFAGIKKKSSNFSPKVVNVFKNEKEIKKSCDGFTNCLSPIQGPEVPNKINLSSSTPIKLDENSNSEENFMENLKKVEEKAKICDADFLEADLFDDWDITEIDKRNKNAEKSTVTFSQALKLIEEAESARDSVKEHFNHSIDLLTGELVGADMGTMFEESFDLPKSAEKCHKESSSENLVVTKNFKVEKKLTAAQKLNFGSEKTDDERVVLYKENNFRNVCFNSDDDFDFFTQDFLKKPKQVLKCAKSDIRERDNPKADDIILLKDCDLNESTDAVLGMKKKKKKYFNIIDSDTTEDSPSPKFHRQNRIKTRKNFLENIAREFIECEAEVSDRAEVSSDEEEEEEEYDKSFLDEKSYFSQNCAANMTAKYLQSVKTVKPFGSFKIPAMKPYNPHNIFSQIPEENNTDYEIDSFCVNEVEEVKSDLSDLEVAEKILEMNRKKRKKKRSQKSKKHI